jgi:hypothetical protein
MRKIANALDHDERPKQRQYTEADRVDHCCPSRSFAFGMLSIGNPRLRANAAKLTPPGAYFGRQ